MANYLITHYRGKYKIVPDVCLDTNDFAREPDDTYDEDMVYISCYNGVKVYYWGLNESRRGVLVAYIPSRQKARNVKKEMKKKKIEIVDYDESDEEGMIKFLASDAETVIEMLKPYMSGLKTQVFSTKNLPKSDVNLPEECANKYKMLSSKVGTAGMSIIRDANKAFLTDVLEKGLRKKLKDKKFSVQDDMRKKKMSRQLKEYIWSQGYFDEYLEYLAKEIEANDA